MLRAILSVSGWTLVSRVTGFARDILMAAVLGAGGLMDAFTVAFRLPNHFRAIFGEGAFSSAFVPAFTRIRTQDGKASSDLFHGRILSLLIIVQLLILVLALGFTPGLVQLLAPGFSADPKMFALAVEITRITFPYLLLITLVTLWSGVLNATGRYAAAAAAPVLLNLSLIAFVLMAALFPTPAHAAGWGVFLAGVLEALLLLVVAWRAGVLVAPQRPVIDDDIRHFFRNFLPAVIGAAGVQIAMFADTIIATLLPTGSASALYYADRIYQLPLGVIAVAAGTVLLPTMSKQIAADDEASAFAAQNRTLAFVLLMAAPFWVATLTIPELVIGAVFQRGAFDARAVGTAAEVLSAYGVGLIAAVSIRSVVAGFHARGDTRTPMVVSLLAVAGNVALKLVLIRDLGVMGLALATALGATVNLAVLVYLADARGWLQPDRTLGKSLLLTGVASAALMVLLAATRGAVGASVAGLAMEREIALLIHGISGTILYAGVVLIGMKVFKMRFSRR